MRQLAAAVMPYNHAPPPPPRAYTRKLTIFLPDVLVIIAMTLF